MKIAIDLRSLSSGSVSGVENYTLNLLDNMLKQDRNNSYTLFFNSFYKTELPEFHYINAKIKITRWPNKLLNLLFKLKLLTLEKLIGDFDVLYMPNLNQFNISKKAKLFLTVHDLSPVITPEFYDLKRQLWHKFLNYKNAFARADKIFAVSEYTKSDLIKVFSLDPNKIQVVYPGIDKKLFNSEISSEKLRQTRNKYGLPGNYILFLNTIEPRKNLLSLIKAFENLKLPCSLVIAGRKGWKYSEVFNAINASPKKHKIKYLGYVPQNDKPAIIKLAQILAYPSYYEGFGFQPMEAAACGTPVLVSNVTSLPEIIENGGMLVNPYNINEISDSISLMLSNKGLCLELTKNAAKVAEKLTWQQTAKDIINNINS